MLPKVDFLIVTEVIGLVQHQLGETGVSWIVVDFLQKRVDFDDVVLRQKILAMLLLHRPLLVIHTRLSSITDVVFTHLTSIDVVATVVSGANRVILRTVPVHHTVGKVAAMAKRAMVLDTQNERFEAIETILVMMTYARFEKHRLVI